MVSKKGFKVSIKITKSKLFYEAHCENCGYRYIIETEDEDYAMKKLNKIKKSHKCHKQ